MPQSLKNLLKNPRFVGGTLIVLWAVFLLYKNSQLDPVHVHLLPFVALEIKISVVIAGAAIVGSVLTLLVQNYWRRWRSSKPASESASTADLNKRTVA